MTSRLSDSLEDYLEAIFHVVSEKQAARPKDIAARLQVKQSSVTGALRALSERGMIHYAPYDLITLTEEGRALGEEVVRRHEALRDFFVRVLRLDEAEADEAACRMEHAVTRTLIDRLIRLAEFFEVCPRVGAVWLQDVGEHCRPESDPEQCEECMDRCQERFRASRRPRGSGRPTLTLDAMGPNDRGRILSVSGSAGRKLVAMGARAGTLVRVESVAAEEERIEIRVRGYHLSLAPEEARGITVEPL